MKIFCVSSCTKRWPILFALIILLGNKKVCENAISHGSNCYVCGHPLINARNV